MMLKAVAYQEVVSVQGRKAVIRPCDSRCGSSWCIRADGDPVMRFGTMGQIEEDAQHFQDTGYLPHEKRNWSS